MADMAQQKNLNKLVVEVSYREDGEGPFLVLDPPRLELHDEQWVVWKFLDIPAGLRAVPALRFDRRLGPFHTLRTAPDLHAVVGKGNAGAAAAGPYTYHAALVTGPDSTQIVTSRTPGEVDNRATRADTTPEVRVRYVPGQNGEPGLLVAEPFVLRLNDGDSPFWTFYDLPAEGAIYLYAPESPQGAVHPLIGPFQSLTSLRSGGGESGPSQFIVGTGQGQSPTGQYTYHMRLVGAGGETLAGGDPIIDNGGPPG